MEEVALSVGRERDIGLAEKMIICDIWRRGVVRKEGLP